MAEEFVHYIEERRKNLKSNNRSTYNNNKLSVADELLKLAELKNQGILSEEEFAVQKEKLLNK